MAFEQRLPAVNGDDGSWGDILNQFIGKEHYDTGLNNVANGGHKTITIQLGTTAAGTAPLKFTPGLLMTVPEVGAMEFTSTTDKLFFTHAIGTTRKAVVTFNPVGATGDVYYRDASNNFIALPVGGTNQVLTVIGGIPSWQTPGAGGGLSQQQAMAIGSMRI